jgi:hypothetical protein
MIKSTCVGNTAWKSGLVHTQSSQVALLAVYVNVFVNNPVQSGFFFHYNAMLQIIPCMWPSNNTLCLTPSLTIHMLYRCLSADSPNADQTNSYWRLPGSWVCHQTALVKIRTSPRWWHPEVTISIIRRLYVHTNICVTIGCNFQFLDVMWDKTAIAYSWVLESINGIFESQVVLVS